MTALNSSRRARSAAPQPPQHLLSRGRHPDRNATTDISCNTTRCSPTRRRDLSSNHRAVCRTWTTCQSLLYALVCGILLCCQSVQAGNAYYGAVPIDITELELVYDRSAPPPRPRMGLYARQDASSSSSAILAPTSTTGSAGSSTASSIATASPSAAASLPRPFDSSLGNNFTSPSCPAFFNSFLNNQTFQDCLPFSLLLQTSNSFFAATQSPVTLVRTLDATCHINYATCSTLMSTLATSLRSSQNCQQDLSLSNPMVEQAYAGLSAYDTLYHAACLTNPDSGNYCFADAVTNASAPTSSYIYYLPLGLQLPAGTRPACNQCLQNTMAIFATAASNASSALSGDYGQAAQMIDIGCGPNFVQQSVAVTGGAVANAPMMSAPALLGLVTILSMILLSF